MSFDFDYIVLNVLMLMVFYLSGKNIQRGRSFWTSACWMIILFTFVLGSRYLRGTDYAHYSADFYYSNVWGGQWAYSYLISFLKSIGFDRYTCFHAYSFIEILCSMVFLKKYAQYGKYIFPFFLIAVIKFDEYQVRQALSFSFVFLYMKYLFDLKLDRISIQSLIAKENIGIVSKAIACLFLATGIHSVNLMLALLITIIYFFVRFPLPCVFTIPLVFFCQYAMAAVFDFSIFNKFLIYFQNDDLVGIYVDNGNQWFSSAGYEEKYDRNVFVGLLECLGTCCLFYLGHRLISRKCKLQEYVTMYNVFVLGILFQMSFRKLELLNRIGGDLALMWFLPLSLVLYYRKDELFRGKRKILFWGLLWYAYEFIHYLFFRGNMTLFLWDK